MKGGLRRIRWQQTTTLAWKQNERTGEPREVTSRAGRRAVVLQVQIDLSSVIARFPILDVSWGRGRRAAR